MLKYVKNHLETIAGIEIFPLISFLIFFTFFLALIIWVVKADKKHIDEIARIPLDENHTES